MGESPSEEEVTDRALQDEIELLGEVIAAAMERLRHLSVAEVDDALGVVGLTEGPSAKALRPAD